LGLLSWFSPSCPADPEEKALVEHGFTRLKDLLGAERMIEATMVEPTRRFFPNDYDASEDAAMEVFELVRSHMAIEAGSVSFALWFEQDDEPADYPSGASTEPTLTQGVAGRYAQVDGRDWVIVNRRQLADPGSLVATIAHELAHVILLGKERISKDEPHMEALTDLAAIYLGLGIFTANSLLRVEGWIDGLTEGWRVQRKGYISPEMAGWALSLFAWTRGETKPAWSKHLEIDGRTYLRRGLRYLRATGDTTFQI
jgi:hypothetical protein